MTTQAESMLQAVAALHGLKATKPQQQDISPDIASHRSSKRQRVGFWPNASQWNSDLAPLQMP